MVNIQIEEKDAVTLKETINKYLIDLRREKSRTEKHQMLDYLTEQEVLMNKLLKQLPQ